MAALWWILCFSTVQYTGIPVPLRKLLGVEKSAFPEYIRSLQIKTAERERAGEYDHLIYYLLQSRQFTADAAIEPALSAREFTGTRKISAAVSRRMAAFETALERPGGGERLEYFRSLPHDRALIEREYARAMDFLYRKEFGTPEPALYQRRGHSTDTQVEANFAVHLGLSVLKTLRPGARLNRVLIVGPGLDFAPRTDLIDAFPPQSYQPFAVADALLELGLAEPAEMRIHCADINPRVVRYLRAFPGTLRLVSILQGTEEYRQYFQALGRHIGAEEPLQGPGLRKTLRVRPEIARKISAENFNILTERREEPYDLVVATNVLLYFDRQELLLALANIRAMMRRGAALIHNEARADVEEFARILGMPPIQARSVMISSSKPHLYDMAIVHVVDR